MPNHFASIGFPAQTEEEIGSYVTRAADEGEAVEVEGGRYVTWPVGQDAQLWVQVDQSNRFIGMNPHFAGQARMRVALTARVIHPGDNALAGAFHGWADPGNNSEGGAYPFVFDAPDYGLYQALELPTALDVRLAAFAHKLDAYAGEEAFYAAQGGQPKLAAESFIPSGLFMPRRGCEQSRASIRNLYRPCARHGFAD